MARLLDCFSSLISFGLALDASSATGRPDVDCEGALREARGLLEDASAAAVALDKPAEQIESARFAMVAWFDEILARHPGCASDTTPMQLEIFNSKNAQSEFFHHLSALQADQDEVREVYWEALALGFKGQYYFEEGDDGELGKLKELHARQLQQQPLTLENLAQERITPQPYATADPPGPRDPQARQRKALRIGAALALLVPLGYLAWFLAGGPHPAPPSLAQRLDQQLQGYACADLAAAVTPDGVARVSGFVQTPEEIDQVRREVRALPGVTASSFALQLRPWPLCEVSALLKPYQARNRDKQMGLAISVPAAHAGRLREGDAVSFQVTNANREGFLWIDYYTADGGVVHLNAGPAQPLLRAGASIELGRDIPSSWLTAPPFGTVLVTALFSPTPFLEAAERPPFELASSYLQRLRTVLAEDPFSAQAIAEMVFLQTVSR